MLRKALLALLCACPLPVLAEDPASSGGNETLFIRDALIAKGMALGLEDNPELHRLVEEFRKDQLARMALEAAIDEGMPDFTGRAREIYQVRKDKQYSLPLRLRVSILEKKLVVGEEDAIRDWMKEIRADIAAGKLSFEAAVTQYSEAANLGLVKGDSQWFHEGQKPDPFYEAAAALTPDKPLSEVFEHRGIAYLLHYTDRKEAETLSFEQVKADIIAELQQEHRETRQKMLLDELREQFRLKSSQNAALAGNDSM